jgi:hypothetical protein
VRHLAIAAELQGIREQSRNSVGVGAELYSPLWQLSEGHLRVFTAPQALSAPDLLIQGDITQHFRGGWHIVVSGDTRKYDRLDVVVFLAGGGWSGEKWFIRVRGGGVRASGETMQTANLMVRRASADGRGHVEVTASSGGDIFDVADAATATPLITGHGSAAALSILLPLSANLGINGRVGLGDYGRFGKRTQFEAGLKVYLGFE